ncbi:MAG: OmpA family protein [Bacteroidota bacterium]
MKVSFNLLKVFPLILALGMMSSCVSKKVYTEALTRAAAEKSALESELAAAREETDNVKGQMAELEQNLSMKSDEIVSLSSEIKKNNQEIAELQNAIKDVFEIYNTNDFNIEEKNGKLYVTLANKILFDSGRDRIKKESKDIIASLATAFNNNPGLNVYVEGHTDSEPVKIHRARFKDNWSLSAARALEVVRLLEEGGVASSRLTASGKGDTQPIADNETEEGRETNRRTEFVIAPKIEGLYKMYKNGFESASSN